jgi:hypothetical protein
MARRAPGFDPERASGLQSNNIDSVLTHPTLDSVEAFQPCDGSGLLIRMRNGSGAPASRTRSNELRDRIV